jgi:dihydrodipicolinate synthase/N-acetylneuraminate lyase
MQTEHRTKKGGLYVPTVTIIGGDEFTVDTDATLQHLLRFNKTAVDGVVILGTTGLGHVIDHNQKLNLIAAVGHLKKLGLFREDFRILTGTGTLDKKQATEIVWAAQSAKLDGVLAIMPTDWNEASELLKAILIAADSGDPDIDVLLYDMPGMPLEHPVDSGLMTAHSGFPTLSGVKVSSSDMDRIGGWLSIAGMCERHVFIGEDTCILQGMEAGAVGAIAGSGNTRTCLPLLLNLIKGIRDGADTTILARRQEKLSHEVGKLVNGQGGFAQQVLGNLI